GHGSAPGRRRSPCQAAAGEPFDKAGILARLGGGEHMLQETLAIFLPGCPGLLGAIDEAITTRDAVALHGAARAVKGAGANFGRCAALDAAARLEIEGRTGNLTEARETFRVLEEAIERLKRELAGLVPAC